MREPEHDVGAEHWLQIDLVVEHHEHARAAWSVVQGVWDIAIADAAGGPARFSWLLRKAPGLRLRVAASSPRALADLDARIEARLQCDDASLGRLTWTRGIYEPERHRFGGRAGAEVAHAMLTASTAAWIRWERARRSGAARLDASVAALVAYDDFVRGIADDGPEQWDVWSRMAELYFGIDAVPGVGRRTGLDLADVGEQASPEERAALRQMRDASARCAGALRDAVRSGATRIGPRAFAVTLATFHWNVWAVDRTALRRALELMVSELDPVPARAGA